MLNTLENLIKLARERKSSPVEGSYTNKLLADKAYFCSRCWCTPLLSAKGGFIGLARLKSVLKNGSFSGFFVLVFNSFVKL